ncbi:MAG: hypothetical protein KGH78_02265 [Candidatus Micrarchaeota archaeon]|nr:hypothetical protein [Candidatus Micrarchaeota archaeon]
MFENVSEGWRIGKAVRKLVFSDRGLLLYPIVAGITVVIEAIVIFLALLLPTGFSMAAGVVAVFATYIVTTFTATYILIAMLLGFRSFTKGKRISMGEAFAQAAEYRTVALEWSIFYSIVIMAARIIESRVRGIPGIILGATLGVAISFATLFSIPVMVDEKAGPITIMKASAQFCVKNFGKSAGGLLYTDLYNMMFIILGGLLLFGSFFAGLSGAAILAALAVGCVLIVLGVVMNSVMSNVFRFVLYEYMNGKGLPEGISEELIKGSIRASQGKQG